MTAQDGPLRAGLGKLGGCCRPTPVGAAAAISYIPFLAGIGLIFVLVAFQMMRSLPAIEATSTVQATSVLGEPRQLTLPAGGASLIAVDGLGTLGANGPQVQRPIAAWRRS